MIRMLCSLCVLLASLLLSHVAVAGVSGTHGPDRASGAVVAKPMPAPTEQNGEQTAKPEEKKQSEPVKESK